HSSSRADSTDASLARRRQTDPASGDCCERVNDERFLSILNPGLESRDRIATQHGHSTLCNRRPGVVVRLNVMNRDARFRFTGLQNGLKNTTAVHPLATELRQEGWMCVENPALELRKHAWPQLLHVSREEHEIDLRQFQSITNCDIQSIGVGVSVRGEMNGRHACLSGSLEGASAAVVADDDHNATRDSAFRTGIEHDLEGGALVRGKYADVHRSR